jgi:hypothetical protein
VAPQASRYTTHHSQAASGGYDAGVPLRRSSLLVPVSSPHWSTVAIAGRACEVFTPPDPLPGRALVSLHDLRGESLRDCPPLCTAVEAARLPVIAPQAGRCWWLDQPIAECVEPGLSLK